MREYEILYEPVGDYEESVCNIKVHVVHEILLPPDYEPGPDSWFRRDENEASEKSDEEEKIDDGSVILTAPNNSSLGDPPATSVNVMRRTTPNQVTRNTIREEQVITDSDLSDGILSGGSDNDDDITDGSVDDDDDSVLIPETEIEWVKFDTSNHETVPYDGPITQLSPPNIRKNGMANKDFLLINQIRLIIS